MGLDMYAYAVDKENAHRSYAELIDEDNKFYDERGDEDSNPNPNPTRREIHYWRKHNALHAWMQDLWESRGSRLPDGKAGGSPRDFNCVPIELTEEDLKKLEEDIRGRKLEPTDGFFFGGTDYTDEDWDWHEKDDLQFIADARQEIADGGRVFYDSWW